MNVCWRENIAQLNPIFQEKASFLRPRPRTLTLLPFIPQSPTQNVKYRRQFPFIEKTSSQTPTTQKCNTKAPKSMHHSYPSHNHYHSNSRGLPPTPPRPAPPLLLPPPQGQAFSALEYYGTHAGNIFQDRKQATCTPPPTHWQQRPLSLTSASQNPPSIRTSPTSSQLHMQPSPAQRSSSSMDSWSAGSDLRSAGNGCYLLLTDKLLAPLWSIMRSVIGAGERRSFCCRRRLLLAVQSLVV